MSARQGSTAQERYGIDASGGYSLSTDGDVWSKQREFLLIIGGDVRIYCQHFA